MVINQTTLMPERKSSMHYYRECFSIDYLIDHTINQHCGELFVISSPGSAIKRACKTRHRGHGPGRPVAKGERGANDPGGRLLGQYFLPVGPRGRPAACACSEGPSYGWPWLSSAAATCHPHNLHEPFASPGLRRRLRQRVCARELDLDVFGRYGSEVSEVAVESDSLVFTGEQLVGMRGT
ncbi:hypothetical protein AXF42_Ash011853 [Apostasia shenzhenica]|uniref:Uncharacterized protein n=1 Tax=Apostasia shenzhenica TaxID=1088818 RepID=A0A2I0AW26_9ASPA|nr:hypothetical protein AXF42_Ash011853 [Apostasia shenzhenica]